MNLCLQSNRHPKEKEKEKRNFKVEKKKNTTTVHNPSSPKFELYRSAQFHCHPYRTSGSWGRILAIYREGKSLVSNLTPQKFKSFFALFEFSFHIYKNAKRLFFSLGEEEEYNYE